ncbi:SDR family oxidoreductase [Microbacterium sp. A84]|uniref:SDR family oxidoreductase n=1 Tax=Microbacterium sp. A84 TaxID=3450715 RepID=UPI003F4213E3
MSTAERYEGRAAIVTGASRGIGLAIARRLLNEGARVVITGRNQAGLDAAVAELGAGDRLLTVAGSADDQQHQTDTVDRTIAAFGRIDLLVNNAGINPAFGPLIESDFSAARKIFDVNVLGSLGWVQSVHEAWMGANGGAVVNVASVAGLRPAADIGLYGASKSAVIYLTGQLAVELGPTVRVNAVAPGVVTTRFAKPLYEGIEEKVVARYPLGRLGETADVASAVAYLGSDDSAWVTGQTLVVDGGLLLGGGI